MTNQTKNNNWIYLVDPTFTKVNRLFVLSFENQYYRTSFVRYYTPSVEIKDKKETYQKIIEIGRNND